MLAISLRERFGARARVGEYAGAETVMNFGSAAGELAALRHGCALFDLGWRSRLVVSGEDRVRWLNGMVTNNTRDLPQDCGNYSFVLNAQGRIQGDVMAFQRGEFYILESEAGEIATLREYFERYIIMDDVELSETGGRLTSIGLAGPQAVEALTKAGVYPGECKPGQIIDGHWSGIGYSLVRDPIEIRNWYELWLAPENVEAVWNVLAAAGAVPVGAQALEWQRILLGLPRIGLETGGRELPQETGQSYALHHNKGCYIGQEIVERIHSRGQVHRKLSGLIVEGEAVPARGSKVMLNDAEVGEVTSSAEVEIDGLRRVIALAYVRRDAAESGAAMLVDGATARVVALPFEF
jgi:aminomethyltransferase